MCNLINTHTHTRMTRPDCAVMCNLINTHTHTSSYEKHRTAIVTGPDYAAISNLINTHTHSARAYINTPGVEVFCRSEKS